MLQTEQYKLVSFIRYKHISEVLEKIMIPYAIIKGEPLSLYAYGKYAERPSGDIDILVSRDNVPLMEKYLIESGYEPNIKLTRADHIRKILNLEPCILT